MTPEASAPAFSVLSALNRRVRSEFDEREPDGYWHPSSIFGCPRQAIYASRGTPITDERDDRSRRVLRVGHLLHGYVQGAVATYPGLVNAYEEVRILDPDRRIKGSVDQVLQYEHGAWEVVEYKTINSMAFKYRDLPKPDHIGQLSCYLSVIQRTGGIAQDGRIIPPTAARGRIAYVSKDDLLIEEYTVNLTPGKEQQIEERIAYLNRYAASDTALPPRLPDDVKKGVTKRAYLCQYCPFQTKCWDEDGPGE